MRLRHTLAGLLLVASSALANNASVEAVIDRTAVEPGKTATLALHFTIQPGWHLYWTNPGETGLPPSVKWDLPAGVTVSELRFPTPKRILANDLTAFGYEESLTLLADVQIPADVFGRIEIKGVVNWLACQEACVAEKQSISVSIPVGPGQSTAADRFKAWQATQPVRPSPEKTIAATRKGEKSGKLSVPLMDGQTGMEFFPPYAPFLVFDTPKVGSGEKSQKSNIYSIGYRVLPGAPADYSGKGIVVLKNSDGKTVAEEMTFTFKLK